MIEADVISLLRDKRTQLSRLMVQMERQLAQPHTDLTHLDAAMQLFDPAIQPEGVRPRRQTYQTYRRKTACRACPGRLGFGQALRLRSTAMRLWTQSIYGSTVPKLRRTSWVMSKGSV
jgi:hypothetical protein